MFEGPVTANIPEVLGNGEKGTHVPAGQLPSDALRASGRPGRKHSSVRQQRSCHPVPGQLGHCRAGLKLDSSALAPAIAPLGGCAGSSVAALQSLLTTGLSNKADQSRAGGRGGHEEHPRRRGPEAVELQHRGRAPPPRPTRITPLEVDTKVPTLSCARVRRSAGLQARKPRRLHLGPVFALHL